MIPLDEWVFLHPEEEERRSLFLNLDRALKYVHEHGYYVEDFSPSHIGILNEDDRYILFQDLVPFSSSMNEDEIQSNIFQSSCLQIGIYTGTLEYLSVDFLKQNFDEFVQLLPADDVPYYRGIIERDNTVYYCDYIHAKSNRDLKALAGEIDSSISSVFETSNDRINDIIYQEYVMTNNSAFVFSWLIPTIFIILLIVLFLVFGGWSLLL